MKTNHRRKFRLILLLVTLALLLSATVALADTATVPDQADLVLKGLVDARPDGAEGDWTIDGTTIVANARTRFIPDAESIVVGDAVEAVAQRARGELTAIVIKKVAPRPQLLRGPIESIDEAAGLWVIGGEEVLLDENTQLSGDTPAVGAQAQAWVIPTDAGLLAKRIVVKGAHQHARPVTFIGTVVSQADSVWTILVRDSEKQVQTDDKTRIVGDPVAGDKVGVKGHAFEDGTIIAQLIVKLDDTREETPFAGFVTDILAEEGQWTWTVERPGQDQIEAMTWTIIVTADTKININPEEVAVGAWVKGAGIPIGEDESVLDARVVRVTRPPKVRFHGEVTAMPDAADPAFPAGRWVIGGMNVYVSADTTIDGAVPVINGLAGGYGALRLDGGIDAALLKSLPPEN